MRFDAPLNRRPLAPLQLGAGDIEAWLLAKVPEAAGAWHSMGADEYARAFTAAQTAGADVVDDIYFALVDTVGRSGDETDFSRLVLPILRDKGWLGGDERLLRQRVGLIYDTNLRLARAAGRWQRFQLSKTGLPYLRAFTARDERVRHPPKSPHADHRAWDGIILPVDHAFWTRWFPPLGFRCRCGILQMSRSQLARYKGGITGEEELAAREARLGTPIFRSPALPFEAQLADMVSASNAEPMPGRPPVDPIQTRARGVSLWEQVVGDQALAKLDDLLARIFGQAA